MNGISTGKALSYATLPGIFPRFKDLFFSGFGNLAYFIALAYAMVRLLPAHHPYLNPENIGKYGIRHVVAAAMHELKFEWKHIDQIIVFFALLAGVVCLLFFVSALVAFLVVSPVMAMSNFVTNNPETDIAFMMLDKVFGLPGMFMSEVETNPGKYGPFPNTFQVGMRTLFQFYSMGLFMLSVFVLLYYIVVVVTETAMTGTPFGQRFDNFWIPLRVIGALALLMPGFGGYSTSQYIVMYAAKWGSSLATNTWITYNLQTGDTPVGGPIGVNNRDLIPKPAIPDYTKLIKDLIVVRGCMEMYGLGGYTVLPPEAPEFYYGTTEWMVKGTTAQNLLGDPSNGTAPNTFPRSHVLTSYGHSVPYNNLATFDQALNFYEGGDIRLVLGTKSQDVYEAQEGYVFPHCGEIIIPVTGQTPEARYVAEGYMAAVIRVLYGIKRSTAPNMLNVYEQAMGMASIREYLRSSSSMMTLAQRSFPQTAPGAPQTRCFFDSDNSGFDERFRDGADLLHLGECEGHVPPAYWAAVIPRYQKAFEWGALAGYDYLTGAISSEDMEYSIGDVNFQTLGDANPMLMDLGILRYGWGGAGLWYNKIAEKNGSLSAAIGATPYVVKYPDVMEKIKNQRLKSDSKVEVSSCEIYNPRRSANTSVNTDDERGAFFGEVGIGLYNLCTAIHDNQAINSENTRSTKNPNMVLNIINALFGASTFFNVLDNRDVHPMSMLSTLGRTLIDKAIFNLAAATGTSVIGGLNQLGPGKDDPGFAYITLAANNFSRAFVLFGSIALVSGVMLYYVMPFMPFMYFFFAVGRWVKTIFEAMVGVPLWALAHLSLKGPGLPSPAANAGYFLILEIFIRPILTVFALIAAFATFAAMVSVLNATFNLLISNIFGADVKVIANIIDATAANNSTVTMRNLVDQFFFTVVYIIIVYIIGTSCFKLIDLIPDNIMRWSGAGVKTFGGSDNADELVGKAGQYISIGTHMTMNKVGDGITGLSAGFADDARGVIQQSSMRNQQKGAAEQEVETLQNQIKQEAKGAGRGSSQPSQPAPTAPEPPAENQLHPAAALAPGASPKPAVPGAPAAPAAPTTPPAPSTGTGSPKPPTGPQAPGANKTQPTLPTGLNPLKPKPPTKS